METYFSVPCPERVRFEKAVFILRHNLLEDQFIKPLNDRSCRPESRKQDEQTHFERKVWVSRAVMIIFMDLKSHLFITSFMLAVNYNVFTVSSLKLSWQDFLSFLVGAL